MISRRATCVCVKIVGNGNEGSFFPIFELLEERGESWGAWTSKMLKSSKLCHVPAAVHPPFRKVLAETRPGCSVPHHWMHHAAQPAWTRRASDASFPFRDERIDKAIDAGSSLVTSCRGPPLRALCTPTHCTESRLGLGPHPFHLCSPPSPPVSSSPRESGRRCPSRRVKRARGRRAAPAPCDSSSNAAVIPHRAPPPPLRVPAFLRSKVLAPRPSSSPLMSSAT